MNTHSRSGVHRVSGTAVLIVDDDADAAELYAIWLRSAGHRVSIVSDAARALILAPVLRPTVAVVDIGLPDLDGIELLGLLQKLPQLTHCRYIAVSAYAGVGLPARCQRAGFEAFFEKPFNGRSLIASVATATRSEVKPEARSARRTH